MGEMKKTQLKRHMLRLLAKHVKLVTAFCHPPPHVLIVT